jgi:hypothetical protein
MTGSDLFVLGPWVIFGAGLAVVLFRLCRPGYSSRRASPPRQPPRPPDPGAPGEAPRPARSAAAGRGRREAGP